MATEVMEQTNQIYQLIPQIMREVGPITKHRENAHQHYKFRGIDDIYNALQGPMSDAGVFCVPKLLKMDVSERATDKGGIQRFTVVQVQYTFFAPDGSSVEVVAPGEAFDSGDKSCNKAMSAALKYACMQLLMIPTEGDNDTENHSHQLVSPANGNSAQASAREPFQPSKMASAPAPSTNKPPGTYRVVSVEEKGGNSNGRAWTKYTIKTDTGDEFVTFDAARAGFAREIQQDGSICEIKFNEKKNGNYTNRNLEEILRVTQVEKPEHVARGELPPPEDGLKVDAIVTSIVGPRMAGGLPWFQVNTEQWGEFYTTSEKIAAALLKTIDEHCSVCWWYTNHDTGKKLITRLSEIPF